MTHYHVSIHNDDEDPLITDDLFAALDYAATELDNLADFEHEGVSITAERVEKARESYGTERYPDVYEMEQALLSFAKMGRYAGLTANAANMVKQHNAKHNDRAPLYQVDFGRDATSDWVYADAAKEADARLLEAAKHAVQAVNDGSPISITECSAEMLTWPERDQMHGGESYCADEYPDGYAGGEEYDTYHTPPLNTQDGPCGDR